MTVTQCYGPLLTPVIICSGIYTYICLYIILVYVTRPCCVHNFTPVYVYMGGNEENEGSIDLFGVQKRVFIKQNPQISCRD